MERPSSRSTATAENASDSNHVTTAKAMKFRGVLTSRRLSELQRSWIWKPRIDKEYTDRPRVKEAFSLAEFSARCVAPLWAAAQISEGIQKPVGRETLEPKSVFRTNYGTSRSFRALKWARGTLATPALGFLRTNQIFTGIDVANTLNAEQLLAPHEP